MINGLGAPQSLLLLGGTSDIGLAIAEQYLSTGPIRVVLGGRASEQLSQAARHLTERGGRVEVVEFDAVETASHEGTLREVFDKGDIDIAVIAFGVLGDQTTAERDPAVAVTMATTNYVGAVSAGVCLAKAMRQQGHGTIVALSSVAAERPRRSNFMYGSTKSGMDAFFSGLSDSLIGTGVRTVVVRPGQVKTKMTAHLKDAPLTTTPEVVAATVVSAVRRGRQTVWVPGTMRVVSSVLRHLPRVVFRRLPF